MDHGLQFGQVWREAGLAGLSVVLQSALVAEVNFSTLLGQESNFNSWGERVSRVLSCWGCCRGI